MAAITADTEQMQVPKPGPDQIVVAICGEDGARCWTVAHKAVMTEPGMMAAMIGILEDGQRKLREDRDGQARA